MKSQTLIPTWPQSDEAEQWLPQPYPGYFTGFCHLPYGNPGPQSLSSRRKPEALTSIPLTMAQVTGPPTQGDKTTPTQLPASFGHHPTVLCSQRPRDNLKSQVGMEGVLWSPNSRMETSNSLGDLEAILSRHCVQMVGLGG